MHLLSKASFVTLLLAIGVSSAPAGLAQITALTLGLIDTRLEILRETETPESKETLRAYETARARLNDAASYERQTISYLDALTSGRTVEAEIRARIEILAATSGVPAELGTLPPEELKAELRLLRTAVGAARNSLDSHDQRLAARETNENLIRTRIKEVKRRLPEFDSQEVPVNPSAPPSMAEALRWNIAAEQISLTKEQRALESRLTSQPIRYAVLRAERAELTLKIERLTAQAHALGEELRSRQSELSEAEVAGIEIDDRVRAIAGQLTEDNARLREQRLDLEMRLDAVGGQGEEVDRRIRALGERFATARRMVDFASDSDVLGKVLLAYWESIDSYRLSEPAVEFSVQVGDTVISRIDHEQALAELLSASGYVNARVRGAGLDPATIPEASRITLKDLARSKGRRLRRIIGVESDYLHALSGLDTGYAQLMKNIEEYEEYLAVLILWEPSRLQLWDTTLSTIPSEVSRIIGDVRGARVAIQPLSVVALLTAGILLLVRKWMRAAQLVQNSRILKPHSDGIRYTIVALLLTGLRAASAPLVLVAIGSLFARDTVPAATLSRTIDFLVGVLFASTFTYTLSEKSGVGEAHFGWPPEVCGLLHKEAGWLVHWWFPVAALASFTFMLADDTAVIGRLALLLAIALLIGHLVRSYRRDTRISKQRPLTIRRNRLRLMLVAMLVVLLVAVVWGLRYSVGLITYSLLVTILSGIGLALLHDLLLRWLRVVQRRLRAAELAAQEERETGEASHLEQDQAQLVEISEDSTELLNASTMTFAVFLLLYIWAPLLPAFNALSGITLWSSSTVLDGELTRMQITLETLAVVVFLLSITIYAARKLPALIELVLRTRTEITAGTRDTTSTLVSYVILGVGTVAALSTLELDWSKFQWLFAAVGVGIGFGLQEIVANFVSGLIILFERPIRVGDIVTVGTNNGEVTKIRIRATTIHKWDGTELLVPNKEFVTGQLVNWTLSDPNIRILIPIGVAYGSDVEKALKILDEVVADHPSTLASPRPQITFENFGDNALELSIRCFLGEFQGWRRIVTELRQGIYKRFNDAGIVIAFPQRDIHFDTGRPLHVVVDSPPTA